MTWRLVPAAFALALSAVLGAGMAQASGDAAKGEKVFNKCKACHTLEAGKNRVGPSLNGLFGRAAGTVEGFKHRDLPVISVQYHPEAGPGPNDALHFFDDFLAGLGRTGTPA